MFFVSPDPFLLPTYRMSPFLTSSITQNNQLQYDAYAIEYFNERFGVGNWKLTFNGRQAIAEALKNYNLSPTDVVTVLTTSQNFYISSCVTKTIEQFCQWNRAIVSETKVILVNHEFGFPFSEMDALLTLGIPIIEDCCTTFFSQDHKKKIGTYGDYAVYSFPKFFPIQVGGLLVSTKGNLVASNEIDDDFKSYVTNTLSYYLQYETTLLAKRKENYLYALSKFSSLGFEARFESHDLVVPYALVLKNHCIIKDLNLLKEHFYQNGIQNSVFYGEDAFFIPNHQNLSKVDIDLMYQCIVSFIKNHNL